MLEPLTVRYRYRRHLPLLCPLLPLDPMTSSCTIDTAVNLVAKNRLNRRYAFCSLVRSILFSLQSRVPQALLNLLDFSGQFLIYSLFLLNGLDGLITVSRIQTIHQSR